ncbi:MAG: peptide deformylase [Parcubacteria group bacterium CG23_combo_of_CG06-09_8_20_14_all_35_9]|nr:MAG: peptide deformylase [Parcubacteria group bacterium CG23_combo_of_CG06-09_8_20_14_all_35_9]
MGLLEIKKYPNPILREKCSSVKEITEEIKKLIKNMFETMYANDGVGLAAPQVGIKKRVIVVDVGQMPIALVNPKILKKKRKTWSMTEGCLSLPEIAVEVKRPQEVEIEGLDKYGKKVNMKVSGFLSRSLQHEIDHLDGILIIDKVGFLKKRRLIKQLMKITS